MYVLVNSRSFHRYKSTLYNLKCQYKEERASWVWGEACKLGINFYSLKLYLAYQYCQPVHQTSVLDTNIFRLWARVRQILLLPVYHNCTRHKILFHSCCNTPTSSSHYSSLMVIIVQIIITVTNSIHENIFHEYIRAYTCSNCGHKRPLEFEYRFPICCDVYGDRLRQSCLTYLRKRHQTIATQTQNTTPRYIRFIR